MSDARWTDVDDDMQSAVHHFGMAIRIREAENLNADDLEGYTKRMGFMQAMQAGYTSMEGGIERILDILGEAKPAGASYHADLVRRVSKEIPGNRPAVFDETVAKAVDEARRFRHVARKNYDNFQVQEAGSAVAAARVLSERLIGEIARFREAIDPSPPESSQPFTP